MRQALLTSLHEQTLTHKEIVERAYHLLKPEKKWAKNVFLARNRAGHETTALARDAVSWTLIGALRRSADELGLPPELGWAPVLWEAYDVVEAGIPPGHVNLLSFNNAPWTTHDDVLKVLVRALDRMDRDSQFHAQAQAHTRRGVGDAAETGAAERTGQSEVSNRSASGPAREAA